MCFHGNEPKIEAFHTAGGLRRESMKVRSDGGGGGRGGREAWERAGRRKMEGAGGRSRRVKKGRGLLLEYGPHDRD